MNLKTKFRFYKVENAPYFGAYKVGSLNDGEPQIMFALDAIMEAVKDAKDKKEAFHDILLQTVTHEFCHAMQEWLNKEYDELEVEKILGAYNDKWNVFQAEEDENNEPPVFSIPDFLCHLDTIEAETANEFKIKIQKLFAPYVNWHEAEKKFNKEQGVQVSDTTDDEQRTEP